MSIRTALQRGSTSLHCRQASILRPILGIHLTHLRIKSRLVQLYALQVGSASLQSRGTALQHVNVTLGSRQTSILSRILGVNLNHLGIKHRLLQLVSLQNGSTRLQRSSAVLQGRRTNLHRIN
ncbi:MAG: hypothetical protein EBR15_10490, partial [Gammaproteobacteria bacterium]|nr:hypothetical protein [Gammaproteobacteria bacterium]